MTPAASETPDAATDGPNATDIVEECDDCGEETAHDVAIQIRAESEQAENAQFSREPYRITECRSCGLTASERLNDR